MNVTSAVAENDMESFAALFEESLTRKEMRAGELITAQVVRIDHNVVVVNAGLKSESFMINEAFAAVVLRFVRDMGLDMEKVNVNGGSIAMGHPLGATGGMILSILVDELHRTGGKYGLATLCVGGGMGIATVVEAI